MGILLAGSSLGSKLLIGGIALVFLYGMCLGPKGTSGSNKGGSRKGRSSDSGYSRNNVKTKDLGNVQANIMQGHYDNKKHR